MKGKTRHDFFYRLTRNLCRLPLILKFNYKFDKIKVNHSPYIVAVNHLTNWDPVLVGLSFRKSMYYVASDHIMRMGLLSKFIEFAISPIFRVRTTQETQTVITLFRRLKEKCNVCIFIEGTTSFDGKTGAVQPSIGKLAKKTGAALVTYRFIGSYFTFARWARFPHKGKMEGRLVQIYSPEKIAAMTEDEIYQAIKKDIYVNAYDEQEKNPIAYRGKKPAEYLETVLYCCPKCRKIGTLASRNDTLSCVCGFKVRYNEFCYFEIPVTSAGKTSASESSPHEKNAEAPFKTITDWVKWEREELDIIASNNSDAQIPVFSDEDQQLYEITRVSHNTLISDGKLCMYKDRLSVDTTVIMFDEIIEMGVITMKTIIFAAKNKTYEIHSKHPRSALKYMDMFNAIKSKK